MTFPELTLQNNVTYRFGESRFLRVGWLWHVAGARHWLGPPLVKDLVHDPRVGLASRLASLFFGYFVSVLLNDANSHPRRRFIVSEARRRFIASETRRRFIVSETRRRFIVSEARVLISQDWEWRCLSRIGIGQAQRFHEPRTFAVIWSPPSLRELPKPPAPLPRIVLLPGLSPTFPLHLDRGDMTFNFASA